MILKLNMKYLFGAADRKNIKVKLSLVKEAAMSVRPRNCLSSSESSMRRCVEIKVLCPLPTIAMLKHLPPSSVVHCSRNREQPLGCSYIPTY